MSAFPTGITYLSELVPAGPVKDTDATFWCDASSGCGVGTDLKRVTALQLANYVAARAPPGGGGGTPGGASSQAQFNNAGAFGGSTGLTLNGTSVLGMAMALGGDAAGDLYYRNAAGNMARLGAGAAGNLLQMTGGLPTWQPFATGGGTVNPGTAGQVAQYSSASSTVAGVTVSGDATIAVGGALTLASVVAAGTFPYPASLTVDVKGRVTAVTGGSAPAAPPVGAAPTAQVGATVIPGSAPTFMRSDAAPALASTITAGGPTGSATVVPVITWNASGQLTAVSTATITGGAGNVTAGATLTLNQLVIGQNTQAVATLGTLGTATTVLHGGAGAPTFGAVNLTMPGGDVTGTVAIGNGGTGATTAPNALTALGAYPAANPNGYQTAGQVTTSLASYLPLVGGTISGAPGTLTINANAVALPAPPASTGLQVGGANASVPRITIDSFGTGATAQSMLTIRRANNTAASPSALQNGDIIGGINAFGFGATVYSSTAAGALGYQAAETWDDTHHGTSIFFTTVPTGGSVTPAGQMTIGQGVQIGTPTGGLQGLGTLNATNLFIQGGGVLPLAGGTMAGALTVGPSFAINLGGDATGDLFYRTAGGAVARLGGGINGYVLTTAGAGTVPSWQLATGGGGLPLTGGTLSGPLVVNLNTAAAQAPLAATAVQISGGDGVVARLELDAYANALGGAANVLMRTTRGTAGTPAVALSAGDLIGGIVYRGHNGTAYSAANRATINCQAAETWNTTTPTESTLLTFATTTLGSTTLAERLHIQAGLQVYNAAGAPTGGDQGAGTINVAGTGTVGAPAYLLNGVAQGRINASAAWIAGANPNNGLIYVADAARTIVAAVGVMTVVEGSSGSSVAIWKWSGSSGVVIHSTPAGMPTTNTAFGSYNYALTVQSMVAGDKLYLVTTGSTWTAGAGGVQVTLQ